MKESKKEVELEQENQGLKKKSGSEWRQEWSM